jgi:hypothetical protein
MLAAALDLRIQTTATWNSPVSFQSLIAETGNGEGVERSKVHPASSFLTGVLCHFDLPDLAAAIAPRAVTIANPNDGRGQPVPADQIARVYRHASQVYSGLGAPEGLQTVVGPYAETAPDVCDALCV